MYAETRAEWMISCLGAFSQNIHVSTVYTNLGDEAVAAATSGDLEAFVKALEKNKKKEDQPEDMALD